MSENKVISVTEAARNFADCVNRAHYQNVTFVLLKNGVPVARLVPGRPFDGISSNDKLCTGRDLAETLRRVTLSEGEAKAWRRDLHSARKKLKAPPDRWRDQ
jgi:antitoxin (DNA-binding transcriptional repressor) of toxin-antitoxin stability system